MTDDTSLAALNRALEFEREGMKYYSKAIEKTERPISQSLFEMLVKEEKLHIDYLQKLYVQLQTEGNWPEEITISIDQDFKLIFKEAARDIDTNVKVTCEEADALSFAIDMENKGRDMYLELSEKAANPKEKDLFARLADWEKHHAEFVEDFYNYFQDHGMFTQE